MSMCFVRSGSSSQPTLATSSSVMGSKLSRNSRIPDTRSRNPGRARHASIASRLSQGPKLTNRLGSAMSRSSFAEELPPISLVVQSASYRHAATNSSSRPDLATQFPNVYGCPM